MDIRAGEDNHLIPIAQGRPAAAFQRAGQIEGQQMALAAPLIRAQHHGEARIGVGPQLPMIRNQAAHRKPLPPAGRAGDRHRHMAGKANGIGRHIRPWPHQQRIAAPEAGIEPKLCETPPPLSVALLHQKPIATGAERPAGQHQRVC